MTQSEQMLEDKLIEQLHIQGYERVTIRNEKELEENFKVQISKHNNVELTDREFDKILVFLNGGNIFKKAEKLRDQFELDRDDGTIKYINFFNSEEWNKNIFQVTNQVTIIGKYKNRYDVTILINGIPLVQIELKKRGIELKQAFDQINRYQKHSFGNLFNYVQIFVISNGVNTKYYANNKELSFKQTFYWTDENNNKYSELDKFSEIFLEKGHIAKMIAKYIVLHKANKALMILRPYQYNAVEKIIKRVEESPNKNGYIWHTTGSGKTLTSFKASQILSKLDKIDKVMFVVDRKDLDNQTRDEFKAFDKNSVDGTDNTNHLVKQLIDDKTKLIVTTIQKLNNAISKVNLEKKMEVAKDKRIVFIFDECHRSQFGKIHHKINEFFTNKQLIGFTGTPIFAENAIKHQTTADLFHDRLHEYVIKDAIEDDNVLGFSVEYYNTFKSKELLDSDGNDLSIDSMQKVEGINTKEVFESPKRLENITDFIIKNHNKKTYNKDFTAMFAISSIDTLIKYYDLFKSKKHNLKIATIFSYGVNEESKDNEEYLEEERSTVHTREKLDETVEDYNTMFGTNHNLNKDGGFDGYFVDISKRVKEKKIDILLVVNMFLTGFDSKRLNTLYVDKNMRYHGLIQAFSRTNRILKEDKSQGNIVCFRNLKERTDEAIRLYSDIDAIETVLMKDFSEYVQDFNNYAKELFEVVPRVEDVDNLVGEQAKKEFVEKYRNLLRVMNKLSTFSEFDFSCLDISEQEFEDYRSKYLDIYDSVKNMGRENDKESILNSIDFEIELTTKDSINVDYIMMLLEELDPKKASYGKDIEFILKSMDGNERLRSKKELIEKFIEENMTKLPKNVDIREEFEKYIIIEREKAIKKFTAEQNLDEDRVGETISEYTFTKKMDRDSIKATFKENLKLRERRLKTEIVEKGIERIMEIFAWG